MQSADISQIGLIITAAVFFLRGLNGWSHDPFPGLVTLALGVWPASFRGALYHFQPGHSGVDHWPNEPHRELSGLSARSAGDAPGPRCKGCDPRGRPPSLWNWVHLYLKQDGTHVDGHVRTGCEVGAHGRRYQDVVTEEAKWLSAAFLRLEESGGENSRDAETWGDPFESQNDGRRGGSSSSSKRPCQKIP